MNCPNCGRPLRGDGLCCACDVAIIDREDRTAAALESIAESLRQLPSNRELLACLLFIIDGVGRGVESYEPLKMATIAAEVDRLIAACKETKNE